MLTDDELTAMRSTVASSLVDTATHTRPTTTVADEGRVLPVAGPPASVACWLVHPDRNGTDRQQVAGQAGQELEPVVLLASTADVRPGDYLDVSGRRYTVRAVSPDRLYLRAEVGLVQR